MADITMCHGDGCPMKNNCYRYTAERSYLQSYFLTSPIKDNMCVHFWKVKGGNEMNLDDYTITKILQMLEKEQHESDKFGGIYRNQIIKEIMTKIKEMA